MKSEGDLVQLKGGLKLTLGKKIAGGLEGTVFEIASASNGKDYSRLVVKLINDSKFSIDKKLRIINHFNKLVNVGKTTELGSFIALPMITLTSDIGYVMKKVVDSESLRHYIHFEGEDFDTWFTTEYPLKKRYQILENLFSEIRKIHLNGFVFSDLSPNNIMVHKSQNGLFLIDSDNLRQSSQPYSGVLGTPGYIAPEIIRKNIPDNIDGTPIDSKQLSNCGRLTVDSDIFSAAVIAFQILTLHHPFEGDDITDGTPEDEERAMNIEVEYIFKEGTDNTSSRDLTSIYEQVTTPRIRNLFYKTFVDGIENPHLRPTDEDFLEAIQDALNLITVCPNCGYSQIYNIEKKEKCISCDETIEPQILLKVCSRFERISFVEGLNAITNNSDLDLPPDFPVSKFVEDDGGTVISTILLKRGETFQLKRQHMEMTTDRSSPYAEITLSNTSDKLTFRVVSKFFEDAYVININSKRSKKLGYGQEFGLNHNVVVIERPHGVGFEIVYCKFEVC